MATRDVTGDDSVCVTALCDPFGTTTKSYFGVGDFLAGGRRRCRLILFEDNFEGVPQVKSAGSSSGPRGIWYTREIQNVFSGIVRYEGVNTLQVSLVSSLSNLGLTLAAKFN